MRDHLKYFKDYMAHKRRFAGFAVKLGVPVWRIIIHDWQKLLPSEWATYVDYKIRGESKDKIYNAWLHHIHYGPHHWQYWVAINDYGKIVPVEMPEALVLEMIADWQAHDGIPGYNDCRVHYINNIDTFQCFIHPNTRKLIEMVLQIDMQRACEP